MKIYISKTHLEIHEENTKDNHNRAVCLNVTKTRLLSSSIFFAALKALIFKRSSRIAMNICMYRCGLILERMGLQPQAQHKT